LGTEVGLQVARQWCSRHSGDVNAVFLKLDFANAFNTVDRTSFLREVRHKMPGLAPWADFCYSHPSKLVFGAHTIASETGVQQGDPLGPLLFSLALQPALQEMANFQAPDGQRLELVFSYLDDLCLAGSSSVVASALNTLKTRCADIGLVLSTGLTDETGRLISKDKCELILTGGAASSVAVGLFPTDFKVVRDGNFELLGGPIGDATFCNSHTQERVAKALKVLKALGETPDPQVALRLLRNCAGFCKMVYSVRVVPASFHADALQTFDAQVRACFEQFTCLHPDDTQWAQATLGTDSGGLGLRSLAKHSNAAFLASRSACLDLCKDLDPAHVFESQDRTGLSPERAAFDAYNSSVNDDKRLPSVASGRLSQKELSKAVDQRAFGQLSCASSASQSRRAHLSLVSASGAGLYLQAVPSKEAKLDNEPALFIAMLRRWLRVPFAEQELECPLCDGTLDPFGDHALVCCGGGDRTRRHNLLRNMAYHAAAAASLNPELERPGLLPQRPSFGSLYEHGGSISDGDSSPSARRPADVYIPRWRGGPPAAWDFAVTSGLRLDAMAGSAQDPEAVLTRYEDHKCSFQDTKARCSEQGITFLPLIMEAVGGGWSKTARGVWSELAKSSALAMGELETASSCAVMLQQRLSMVLHRENARACLRRF